MSRAALTIIHLVIILAALLPNHQPSSASGRILTECEAARELDLARVSRTFISNFVCLMKYEGNLNTSLLRGPGTAASFSHGVFQIPSLRNTWCIRGRQGGACRRRCEDFLDDNIQDDIRCALEIFKAEGFKYWAQWLKRCKGRTLPGYQQCYAPMVKSVNKRSSSSSSSSSGARKRGLRMLWALMPWDVDLEARV